MAKKTNIIETKGTIFKESGNGYFNVELEEPAGHECLCRASGRLITRKIHLLVGDRVTVELSPYDLSRGRITLREK
jgi:translation initiation factor IF-1|tara:strand:+ start:96 stop:323 length:228 start_codon:yes stop_codon:yes gene_type:complete